MSPGFKETWSDPRESIRLMWHMTNSCIACKNPEGPHLWSRSSSSHGHQDEHKILKGLLPTPLLRLFVSRFRKSKERLSSEWSKWLHPRWRYVSLSFHSLRYIITLLRSPYCSRPRPDPLRSEAFPIPKNSALSEVTLATVHPQSPPMVTPNYFPPRS